MHICGLTNDGRQRKVGADSPKNLFTSPLVNDLVDITNLIGNKRNNNISPNYELILDRVSRIWKVSLSKLERQVLTELLSLQINIESTIPSLYVTRPRVESVAAQVIKEGVMLGYFLREHGKLEQLDAEKRKKVLVSILTNQCYRAFIPLILPDEIKSDNRKQVTKAISELKEEVFQILLQYVLDRINGYQRFGQKSHLEIIKGRSIYVRDAWRRAGNNGELRGFIRAQHHLLHGDQPEKIVTDFTEQFRILHSSEDLLLLDSSDFLSLRALRAAHTTLRSVLRVQQYILTTALPSRLYSAQFFKEVHPQLFELFSLIGIGDEEEENINSLSPQCVSSYAAKQHLRYLFKPLRLCKASSEEKNHIDAHVATSLVREVMRTAAVLIARGPVAIDMRINEESFYLQSAHRTFLTAFTGGTSTEDTDSLLSRAANVAWREIPCLSKTAHKLIGARVFSRSMLASFCKAAAHNAEAFLQALPENAEGIVTEFPVTSDIVESIGYKEVDYHSRR